MFVCDCDLRLCTGIDWLIVYGSNSAVSDCFCVCKAWESNGFLFELGVLECNDLFEL